MFIPEVLRAMALVSDRDPPRLWSAPAAMASWRSSPCPEGRKRAEDARKQFASGDQNRNAQRDQGIAAPAICRHVFFWRTRSATTPPRGAANRPTSRRLPSSSRAFRRTGDFEDQPAADEHLDVHRCKVAAQRCKEPTVVDDAESIEHRVPAFFRQGHVWLFREYRFGRLGLAHHSDSSIPHQSTFDRRQDSAARQSRLR